MLNLFFKAFLSYLVASSFVASAVRPAEMIGKVASQKAVHDGLPITTPACRPNLEHGDENDKVTQLQEVLVHLGYSVGKVDGNFGDATQSALISFQREAQLGADGIYGCKSKKAMDDELSPEEDYARHVGKFLSGYAGGDSTVRSPSGSQSRCDALGSACGGYTCDAAERACTVRASSTLRHSRANEISHVKSSDDDNADDTLSQVPAPAPSDVSSATLTAWKKVPVIDICNLPASFHEKVRSMTTEPDVVRRMRTLNYKVNEEPGHVNVASIRVKSPQASFAKLSEIYSNTFRDTMYIVWRACDDSSKWMVYETHMTTLPGTGSKGLEGRSLTSALAAGQYHNVYCKGTHGGNAAMRHASEMKQWLIKNNGKPKYSASSSKHHSLNFHGTTSRGTTYESKRVNNWSLGCQVTSGAKFYDEVLALIFSSTEKHPESAASMQQCRNQNYGGRTDCNRCMTYTLIEPTE